MEREGEEIERVTQWGFGGKVKGVSKFIIRPTQVTKGKGELREVDCMQSL